MRLPAYALSAGLLILALSTPSPCAARSDDGHAGPTMLSYGLRGFWTGAELGLATGYLATGPRYTSGEWRKLVLGAGIGALTGIGIGITLGIVDTSHASRPPYGWFVLRDMGYGALLGALSGAAVGALLWVDHGSSKDVLVAGSAGVLIGAAAGALFGVIEGVGSAPPNDAKTEHPPASSSEVRFTLVALPGRSVLALGPGLVGRF